MCRNFLPDPLPGGTVSELLDQARRSPSAGNTQAVEFCVVNEPERYWCLTLTPERRAEFPWPGLLAAPMLVVVLTEPGRYVRRYSEPDKSHTGLGESADAWSVPYWWVDAGMAVHSLLLGASAAGLGACFFGAFEHEQTVVEGLDIPEGRRVVGTVALGYPAPDRPSTSAARPSTSAARPSTSAARPSTSAARPSTSAARPSTSAARPSTSAARPRRPLHEVVYYGDPP